MLAAVVLVLAGAGTWIGLSGSGSHAKAAMKMSQTPKPKPTPNPLMSAIVLANKSGDATGKLPPSTCKQTNATIVTCTAPRPASAGSSSRPTRTRRPCTPRTRPRSRR